MQTQLHQYHVADVGQDMVKHPGDVRGANGLGRHHILARTMLHVLGAYQPVNAGPTHQTQNDDHGPDPIAERARQRAGLEHRRQCEYQQDVGDGGEHVVNPLQKITRAPPEIAADGAQNGADQRGKQGRRQPHRDGHLCALDDL